MTEGRLVQIDDTSLFVEERGDGYPVLVLHGGPGVDHHVFAGYLDPLTDRCRLVFVDQRAHGSSPSAPEETWTLPRLAQDVIMLARALGLERYAVLGHAFGAHVALQNAVDYPGMAAQTILVGGLPSAKYLRVIERNLERLEPEEIRDRVARALERAPGIDSPEAFASYVRDVTPFLFADPEDARIPGHLERTAATIYSPAWLHRDTAGIEVEERLAEVAAPVLAVTGRFDRVHTPTGSKVIAAGVPRAELEVFERSGHLPFVEEPERFVETIANFLERYP